MWFLTFRSQSAPVRTRRRPTANGHGPATARSSRSRTISACRSIQTVPTAAASLAARDRVELAAHAAARDERGAAGLARSALFEEALLGALKARFAELRTVAK